MHAMLIRKKNNSINEKNKLMTIQIDKDCLSRLDEWKQLKLY